MEKINLLDLDNDILNIIGDYIKKDNLERMKEEEKQNKKIELFNYVDFKMKHIRKEARKENRTVGRADARLCSFSFFSSFYRANINNDYNDYDKMNEMFEEYLTLKKLNLKKK